MRAAILILMFLVLVQPVLAGGPPQTQRDVEVRCVSTGPTFYDIISTRGTQSGNSGEDNCQESVNKTARYKAKIGETIQITYTWCTKTGWKYVHHSSGSFRYWACLGDRPSGSGSVIVTTGDDPIKISLRNHKLEIED